MPANEAPFEFPENLGELTREQLTELEGQLLARFAERQNEAPLDELTTLRDQLRSVTDAGAALDQRESVLSDLAAFGQARADRPDRPDRPDPTVPAAPVAQPASETPQAPAGDPGTGDGGTQTDGADAAAPAEVIAASAAPSIAEIAGRAPRPVVTTRPRDGEWFGALTAAAELDDLPLGARFESGQQVIDAFQRRTVAIAHGDQNRTARVASVNLDFPDDVSLARTDSDHTQTSKILTAVARFVEARDRGEHRDALTAAGFCAPRHVRRRSPATE